MKKRRKVSTKIKSKRVEKSSEQIQLDLPPFHESFPFTLHLLKDKEKRVCYFVCEEHMKAYIKRYKLNAKEIKIEKTKPRVHDEDEQT